MKRTVTLRPGARGTKRLCEQFGEQLLYVRYRYDRARSRRYKTVELVVEEGPWAPKRGLEEKVWVRIGFKEYEIRQAVRSAGGRWDATKRLWEIRADVAEKLGLGSRIVPA